MWWEADDCQCKTEECHDLSVIFKSSLKEEVSGTCGRRSWNGSAKVLSFSLYGNDSDYWTGFEDILLEVKLIIICFHSFKKKKKSFEVCSIEYKMQY